MLRQNRTNQRMKWQLIMTSLSLMLAALVLLGPLAGTALAGQNKTAVCHLDDEGNYIPITIADPALPAHLAHGDLVVGEDVDENCQPLVADADGDGVADTEDNCVNVANSGQEDRYGSAAGDACEDLDGDGTPDVNEADFCLSIDGVLLESRGTAVCNSRDAGAGSNVAVANGDGAEAYAAVMNDGTPLPGDNNSATAIGDGAEARAGFGNSNSAKATGSSAFAGAGSGANNSATATGDGAFASAGDGNNNNATATGNEAASYANQGDNNSAMATGDGAFAEVFFGNNSSATATGDGATAQAVFGDNNIATADGANTYACAGNGDSGETAVNEDLCD